MRATVAENIVLCRRKGGFIENTPVTHILSTEQFVNGKYRAKTRAIQFDEVTDNGGHPEGMKGTVVQKLPHCRGLRIG